MHVGKINLHGFQLPERQNEVAYAASLTTRPKWVLCMPARSFNQIDKNRLGDNILITLVTVVWLDPAATIPA